MKKQECVFTNNKVLELHDGELEVRILEARTAKLVETRTFKGTSPGGCPLTDNFWGQRDKRMLKVEPAFAKYLADLEGSKGAAAPVKR